MLHQQIEIQMQRDRHAVEDYISHCQFINERLDAIEERCLLVAMIGGAATALCVVLVLRVVLW